MTVDERNTQTKTPPDTPFPAASWRILFLAWFVPCFLFGLISLSLLLNSLFSLEGAARNDFGLLFLARFVPINTLLCGTGLFVLSTLFKRRIAAIGDFSVRIRLTGVALAAGALAPFMLIPWGIFVASLLVIVLAGRHVLIFFRGLRLMLSPEFHMTWKTLGSLCLIYVNLMTAITVINLNLVILAKLIPEIEEPFVFSSGPEALIDAVYFSIVLLTTVGFGDIHPTSALAKCLVAVECLVGYVMFAVLIGLVVRGVTDRET